MGIQVEARCSASSTRFKSRLVAQGYALPPGLGYDQMFSPDVHVQTVRMLRAPGSCCGTPRHSARCEHHGLERENRQQSRMSMSVSLQRSRRTRRTISALVSRNHSAGSSKQSIYGTLPLMNKYRRSGLSAAALNPASMYVASKTL